MPGGQLSQTDVAVVLLMSGIVSVVDPHVTENVVELPRPETWEAIITDPFPFDSDLLCHPRQIAHHPSPQPAELMIAYAFNVWSPDDNSR